MPKPKTKKTTSAKKEKTPRKKRETKVTTHDAPEIKQKPTHEHAKKNYLFAVGRRKSSIARVRFFTDGDGSIIINNRALKDYFPYFEFQQLVLQPLVLTNLHETGAYSIRITGGGTRGQAEAARLGISRILLLLHPETKSILKSNGLLRRDSRVKERKKYGLRKARRAPQWQKR